MGTNGVEPTFRLARHVPRIALDWLSETPDERRRLVEGSLVFADISGFTALSERLAERGRVGAEELVETLSQVFGAMLETAARRGGQLLKFGGDALLFLFPDGDHPVDACSAAVEMRRELRRAAEMETSVGRLSLSASMGVHTGDIQLFLVGESSRELVVAGPAVSSVLACEGSARAGQIVVSAATASRLPARAVRRDEDGNLRLRWRTAASGRLDDPPALDGFDDLARRLLPAIVADEVDGSRPDPAHRTATICFMRFGGTDEMLRVDGPAAVADRVHETLCIAQEAFLDEDVALLAVDCDTDGGKIFCSSGVPLTSEDDEGRMLRAARRIVDRHPPLALQIGISRGHVFVAEVGNPQRASFSAMGDTTNLAARICAKTPPGAIYVDPAVLEHSRTVYESKPVGPFTFKGKSRSRMLNEVGEEVGTRDVEEHDEFPMLGRDTELAALREHLLGAAGGVGGVVEVTGVLGVGKSRLVREALASFADLEVLSVQAEPYGAASAYRVFRDLVRSTLGVARDTQPRMVAELRRSVGRLMPEAVGMEALLGDVAHVDVTPSPEVETILPRYRADRTADVVIELLADRHQGPLVLRVEDAQWMDDASAALVRRLRAEAARRPWLVIEIRRSDDVAISSEPGPGEIVLGPLDTATVRDLTLGATESAPRPPHEVDQIVERAGGNPLFVGELVRATQELGTLNAVPSSLQGAMAAQVDALDPFARRVLSYASVLGRSFRRTVFTEALRAEQIDVDPSTYDRLRQFLEPEGEARWRFRNGLVRDVTYDGLGYRLRARLHLRAGEAVERISADRVADADTLALHFAEAGDDPRTFAYAVIAADRAARAQANGDAAILYQRALEAARRLSDVDDSERYRLQLALGEARERAGLLDGALAAYRVAAALRRGDLVEQCEVRLRRARVHEVSGAFPVALGETTRIRSLLADEPGVPAASLRSRAAAYASTIRVHQERPAEVLRLAELATIEAEACGELSALARAFSTKAWARMVTGQGDGTADAERALELYRELGDLQSQAHMENNLGVQAYFAGHWTETLDRYRRASVACRRVGDLNNAALTDANIGEVLVNQGRLEEAEPLLRDAARTLRSLGSSASAGFAEMHLGRALVADDQMEEAERLLRRSVDLYQTLGSESAYEAALHLAEWNVRAGRPAEALRIIDEAADHSHDEMTIFAAAAAIVTAESLLAIGREQRARERIAEGVLSARTLGLEFDLARLLVLAGRIGEPFDERLGTTEPLEDARRLFDRLGVSGSVLV